MTPRPPVEVGRLDPSAWLGRRVRVVIDRPLGSLHPDGEELDAYVVGPETPVVEYEGEVVGVVLRADDVEDK